MAFLHSSDVSADSALDLAVKVTRQIVRKHQPILAYQHQGDRPETDIVDQLHIMYKAGALPDYPGMYANAKGYARQHQVESSALQPLPDTARPDTRRQSIPHRFIERAESLRSWLGGQPHGGLVVLNGATDDQRRSRDPVSAGLKHHTVAGETVAVEPPAAAYVTLPDGDYFALRRTLELLRLRHREWKRGEAASAPLYILNEPIREGASRRYWDGVLNLARRDLLTGPQQAEWQALGMPEARAHFLKEALVTHGVYVLDSEDQLKAALQGRLRVYAPDLRNLPPDVSRQGFVTEKYRIPAGSNILDASTSPDKLDELQKVTQPYDARSFRLDHLVNVHSPPEKSGTYTGNAGEKMRAAIDAVRPIYRAWERRARNRQQHLPAYHGIDAAMQATLQRMDFMGIDPQRDYLRVEDSGLHLNDPRIFERDPQTGAFRFFDPTGLEHGLNVHDWQFPGAEFGPATNSALGEKVFFERLNEAVTRARQVYPDIKPVVICTSMIGLAPFKGVRNKRYEFQLFSGTSSMNLLPVPQPPEEYAIAAHSLAPRDQPEGEHYSQTELDRMGDRYLLSYSPRMKAMRAAATACGLAARRSELARAAMPFEVHVYGAKAGGAAAEIHHALRQDGCGLRHTDPADGQDGWSTTRIEAELARSDATVLLPSTPEHRYNMLDTLFSNIVARQTHPRDKSKPLIVYNADHHFDGALAYYRELVGVGMIKDPKMILVQEVASAEQMRQVLHRARDNKVNLPEPPPRVPEPVTLKESGKFNVGVFCSASTKNQGLIDHAFSLGHWLAANDCGVVFGVGDRSMMGAVWQGALSAEKILLRQGKKLFMAGSSTEEILIAEADHKQALCASVERHGQFHLGQDIYERMQYMIRQSNAFVVMPGGAGTVQELTALLMLKQEGSPDMQNKPIVIMDTPYAAVGTSDRFGERGFFSGLLEDIPQAERGRLGIHVCRNMDEVTATLKQLRKTEKACPDSAVVRLDKQGRAGRQAGL